MRHEDAAAGAAGVGRRCGPRIEALLAESPRWTGGKQRLTATRLHELLRRRGPRGRRHAGEGGGGRVEAAAARGVRAADVSAGRSRRGRLLRGARRRRRRSARKAWLFLMRLMYSGRDFAWIYERQDQVSFLDGHVRAFAHFGRRAGAHRVRQSRAGGDADPGRRRADADAALRGARVALPASSRASAGRATGHDKGGVEARGKAIRLQALVPIPSGPTLDGDQRGAAGAARCAAGARRAMAPARRSATRFAEEQPRAAARRRAVCRRGARRVRDGLAARRWSRVEGAYYSVPCRVGGPRPDRAASARRR